MIRFIIPLIGSYFSSGIAAFWLVPFVALGLLATMPVILRYFVRWR